MIPTTNKIHAALAISLHWAIESGYAENALEAMAGVDAEFMAGNPTQRTGYAIETNGDVLIRIDGPMMKGESSWGDSCSTVKTKRAVQSASNDPQCNRIILAFDSPGGTVEGTGELADTVRKAAQKKPVIAYIEDTCASAALWVASACSEIVASRHANTIGSIGIYTVLMDRSEQAAKSGVKPILVSSGGVKGQPTAGLPVSAEFLEYAQDRILTMYEAFVDSVASDRGLDRDRVLSIADGRVFTAQEALGLGLIDKLMSFDELMSPEVKRAHQVRASASEATKEDMGLLDRFKNKAPEAPPAAVETTATPQAEVTEAHDMAAIEAAMKNSVVAIVKSKVDRYIDAGLLTTATSNLAANAINAAIEADGLSFEANGALVEGPMQQAVKALIEGLPKADLSTPKLPTAGGDDKRSVVVEEDQFKSDADRYRERVEASTPGMKKVKK